LIDLSATITGDKQLDRKLIELGDKSAKKAMRAGVNAGLAKIAMAIRAAINATSASPEMKAEARKTIGKRFAKAKAGVSRGEMQAKVGFGVGKKRQTKEQSEAQKQARKLQRKKGVGIGAANIHWFVLGTVERHLKRGSVRGPKAGHPTGKITPPFASVIHEAVAASEAAALEAAREKVQQVIIREAQRKG